LSSCFYFFLLSSSSLCFFFYSRFCSKNSLWVMTISIVTANISSSFWSSYSLRVSFFSVIIFYFFLFPPPNYLTYFFSFSYCSPLIFPLNYISFFCWTFSQRSSIADLMDAFSSFSFYRFSWLFNNFILILSFVLITASFFELRFGIINYNSLILS